MKNLYCGSGSGFAAEWMYDIFLNKPESDLIEPVRYVTTAKGITPISMSPLLSPEPHNKE